MPNQFRTKPRKPGLVAAFCCFKVPINMSKFSITDSVCEFPHLEFCDILKHHVHVIVETAQSADKLFVALQNYPYL